MIEPPTTTHEDSAASSQRLEASAPRSFCFLVLECDRPVSGGARYALAGVDEVVIGRGTDRRATRQVDGGRVRLVVHVPGRSMSGTHARLLPGPDGWILEDCRSTNGSFVNGYKVDRALLRDDDLVELGHVLFFVRRDLPTTLADAKDLDSSELASEPPGFATLLPHAHPSLAGLARVAMSKLPLLLLGETGTGKEVLARSVHALSGREGPFMAVNCGAFPPNLVESHLFGHVKGAFSGAVRDEPGAIRAAQSGTLLFDEVGDLPRTAQPTLLRFLQEGEVWPVGSSRPVKVDVRVVAATHRPLGELVESGDFRADLLARLSGFVHALPPLCDRREDIGLFVGSILAKHGLDSRNLAVAPSAGRRLLSHDWPANIRELEHALVRGFTLTESDRLEERHLLLDEGVPAPLQRSARPSKSGSMRPLSETDAQLRRDLVAALERCNGNIADVARTLGKARMQIHRWIKRFEIDPALFRR